MKIYSKKTVLEAALERINFLFDEFENVVIGFSGGKDSTVVLNLALQVAKERNRLPLSVMWIDQEAEWQGTVDYVESIMTRSDIKPYWFQMPMVITNNASSYNRFSYCWRESDKDKWIHEKHDISLKENKYGTDRFHELFEAIFKIEFKRQKSCYLSGVRTEESPKRFVALTERLTYKWITWGKKLNEKNEHYTFYPIYDWNYTDIWKFINDNNISYNRIYNEMYRLGIKVIEMRISNLHHETALQNLLMVQEIEPKTWNKIADRIDGASSIKHIKRKSFTCPEKLPYMFNSWKDYFYYLMENIIQDEDHKKQVKNQIKNLTLGEEFWTKNEIMAESYYKAFINTILSSDYDFTKMTNWRINQSQMVYRYFHQNKLHKLHKEDINMPFFNQNEKQIIKNYIDAKN
jgi:predicted phosphoadenosine phosphosulfate sulfurtransferase